MSTSLSRRTATVLVAEAVASVVLFALIVGRLLPFTEPNGGAWPFVLDRGAILRDFVLNAVVPSLVLLLVALRVRRSRGGGGPVAGALGLALSR